MAAFTAKAQLQQVLELPNTWVVYASSHNTILAANLRDDFSGGVYYSEDQGATWNESDAIDYNYSKFIEHDGDIYALGCGCIIAKSADGGKTWTYVDYAKVAEPYAPKGYIEGCVCYGAASLGNRLYVADLYCGVIYTEDKGETWVMTDRKSITYADSYGEFLENVYGMVTFNDRVYALGMYSIFAYDEDADKWDYMRGSNCLSIYTQFGDKLVCGRAIANDDEKADFLLWTDNGKDWAPIKRPAGMIDNYIRGLEADENNIYVGMLLSGLLYTPDFGETWIDFSEGLPTQKYGYYNVINLAQDRDYLYVAVYDSGRIDRKSGVYRIAKADMPTNSVHDVTLGSEPKAMIANGMIRISGEFKSAVLYDSTGKQAMTIDRAITDASALAKGVYVCVITHNDGKVTTCKISK